MDTHPMKRASFCFLRSSMFGPGVMVGSAAETDGVTIEARLLEKSADATKAFEYMTGLFYVSFHCQRVVRTERDVD